MENSQSFAISSSGRLHDAEGHTFGTSRTPGKIAISCEPLYSSPAGAILGSGEAIVFLLALFLLIAQAIVNVFANNFL